MTVVVLGTVNVFISYAWLVETKGIVLDKVEIKDEKEERDKSAATNGELSKIIAENEEKV